jgi:hypothetical protein
MTNSLGRSVSCHSNSEWDIQLQTNYKALQKLKALVYNRARTRDLPGSMFGSILPKRLNYQTGFG